MTSLFPEDSRWMTAINNIYLHKLFTDAPVKQKDRLLTSTFHCLRDQREMKKNRKCAKQKPCSPGGHCRCSTDGGGYETLQSHYSHTAGGLNKPVQEVSSVSDPVTLFVLLFILWNQRVKPYSPITCAFGISLIASQGSVEFTLNTLGQSVHWYTLTQSR